MNDPHDCNYNAICNFEIYDDKIFIIKQSNNNYELTYLYVYDISGNFLQMIHVNAKMIPIENFISNFQNSTKKYYGDMTYLNNFVIKIISLYF